MNKKELLNLVNSNIDANEELNGMFYRGKCFVIAKYNRVERVFKTKRGAEGWISKNESFSYYDDYSQELIYPNRGLEVIEVLESEYKPLTENKMVWYNWLKSCLGAEYMYNSIECTAKRYLADNQELLNYVLTSLDDVKNKRGLTVYIEEDKQEQVEEINKKQEPVATATEQKEVVNNNVDVTVKFNEDKNGIELYFDNRPNAEMLTQLKANGFRWSKFQKIWYAKDNEERRNFLINLGVLKAENKEEKEEVKTSLTPKSAEIIAVEVDDITQYTIDKELSKRENECHWVFRSKERDHTQELQNYLISCKDSILEVLEDTENISIKNNAINYLNRYMKKYNDLFTRMIRNRAEMPSVAVAGAGNYNFRKLNKSNDRYNNLLSEYSTLTDSFKSKLSSIKYEIKKEKDKKTFEKINAYSGVYNDLKLSKVTVKYNPGAIDNIFVEATAEKNAYKYNDYYIIKNWGAFKIYDSVGNMQYIENIPCSCSTLKDAKLFLCYIINNESEKAA